MLTAIGLSPGGSSTVHIYTQTIDRTTRNTQYIEQHKNFGRVRAVPRLGELHPGNCLTTEEKARKNLSQGILFIIIIGGILALFIYITRLASNEVFSTSNKIHPEVGRAKDLSAPLYNLLKRRCLQTTQRGLQGSSRPQWALTML